MKVKQYTKIYCVTCKNKALKTIKEYNKHFNKNHEIRTRGQFYCKAERKEGLIAGIALTDCKAGEELSELQSPQENLSERVFCLKPADTQTKESGENMINYKGVKT